VLLGCCLGGTILSKVQLEVTDADILAQNQRQRDEADAWKKSQSIITKDESEGSPDKKKERATATLFSDNNKKAVKNRKTEHAETDGHDYNFRNPSPKTL
jgi:hypothetical protein